MHGLVTAASGMRLTLISMHGDRREVEDEQICGEQDREEGRLGPGRE